MSTDAPPLSSSRALDRELLDRKLEAPPVVTIDAAPRGRATGWSVVCSRAGHGAMPVLARNRRAAVLASGRHLESEHGGKGKIVDASRRSRGRGR